MQRRDGVETEYPQLEMERRYAVEAREEGKGYGWNVQNDLTVSFASSSKSPIVPRDLSLNQEHYQNVFFPPGSMLLRRNFLWLYVYMMNRIEDS